MTWGVLAQVGSAIPTSSWELIQSTDPVTKAVLALLAVLSVMSWTIVLAKWREFARVTTASRTFMREVAVNTWPPLSARTSWTNPYMPIPRQWSGQCTRGRYTPDDIRNEGATDARRPYTVRAVANRRASA